MQKTDYFRIGRNMKINFSKFSARKKGKILPLKVLIRRHSLSSHLKNRSGTDEDWVSPPCFSADHLCCLTAARLCISLCIHFPVEPKYKMETFPSLL